MFAYFEIYTVYGYIYKYIKLIQIKGDSISGHVGITEVQNIRYVLFMALQIYINAMITLGNTIFVALIATLVVT